MLTPLCYPDTLESHFYSFPSFLPSFFSSVLPSFLPSFLLSSYNIHVSMKLLIFSEDGSSILVRQCSRSDWGSHCGLIQYEAGGRLENIDGCLEACNFDGCNLATKPIPKSLTILLTIVSLLSFLLCRSCV